MSGGAQSVDRQSAGYVGISAAKTRIGGPMKPLLQEANSFITAGNGTTIEGFREQDT